MGICLGKAPGSRLRAASQASPYAARLAKKFEEFVDCEAGLVNKLSKETNLKDLVVGNYERGGALESEENHVASALAC